MTLSTVLEIEAEVRDDLGHLTSFVTRMLIVVVAAVSVSVVTAILLVRKWGMTGKPDLVTIVFAALAIIIPATLAVAVNYLYWRPRYRVP